MSLLGFQLALADLSASVELCAKVAADPQATLAGYELTPLERRRIEFAAGQQGMRVNVALYRYNRIVTLVTVLPGTIHLLGAEARAVVDEYWAGRGPDRNMRRESQRFAAFIRRALDTGRVASPYLREVVDFEIARYEVAVANRPVLLEQVARAGERWPAGPLVTHPLVRVATFAHDPAVLLTHLAYKRPPPYPDAAEGTFHVLLEGRGPQFEQRPLDAPAARLLLDPSAADDSVDSATVERLVAEGLLVRGDPAMLEARHPLAAGEIETGIEMGAEVAAGG
jgi:hypothetical protein